MIKYINLGANRQLNEIVIAGSHDAAITSGGANAKTQALDIHQQAVAGVRFFDIRIAARTVVNGSGKDAELTAFHSPGLRTETKTRFSRDVNRNVQLERSKLSRLGGVWGVGLTKILQDAKRFVESADYSDEFLILKFDKCTNWSLIAETCRAVLGGTIYSAGGNINEKTLRELSGKVICAFMPSGYSKLTVAERNGISQIKNLFKPPAGYDRAFDGLQYWGSGGTPINNAGFAKKIEQNFSKQKKIMEKAATGIADKRRPITRTITKPGCLSADPNVMGMMYWTTTGANKSIRDRNDLMWSQAHVGGLDELWQAGFKSYVDNALPADVDACSFTSGGTLKLFMPNIVMIDFADSQKCEHIHGLNTIASVNLVKVCQRLDIHGGYNSLG